MTTPEASPITTQVSSGFIPLNEIPSPDLVQWGLEVPDFGDRQLTVHVDRLGGLARLAGFHSLALVEAPHYTFTMPEDESEKTTDSKTPQVTALIHGGQAGQLQSDVMNVVQAKHYLWPDCTVEITPPDLASIGNGLSKNPARLWAQHLDKSIKLGLYMAAREHLVLDTPGFAKQMLAFEAANLSLIPLSGTVFMKAAIGWLTLNQLVNFGEAIFINQFLGIPPKERRFSFFYATQIDRLAALRLKLAIQRIVKTASL